MPSVHAEYDRLQTELRSYKDELQQLVDLPTTTRDGIDDPAAGQRQQVRRHRAGLPVSRRRHRPLPHRIRLLDPHRLSQRGRAVRIPQTRGRTLPPAQGRAASAGHRRRQGAALFPAARVAQSVAGPAGHPRAAEEPAHPQAPAARVPAHQRRTPDLDLAAGGGRRRRGARDPRDLAPGPGRAGQRGRRLQRRRFRWAP